MFHILPYLYIVNNDKTQNKLYFMYTITEQILPVLFIGLSTYFVGSVIRLFIHLLICQEHGNN